MKTVTAIGMLSLLFAAGTHAQDMPKPQKEHEWLQQIVGDWDTVGEIVAEPGQPTIKNKGSESCRLIGGFWALSEHKGEIPGAGPFTGIFTLGYSPEKKKYVGTWIDSVSTHLWTYQGSVDASGKILSLETEGPGLDGKPTKFREVIEVKDKDHKVFTSSAEKDGKWTTFLTMSYTRKK